MSEIKRVMRRAGDRRVATFRLEAGRVIATYDDVEYGRQFDKDGITVPSGILRPSDGQPFYDAIDHACIGELFVTVAEETPPPSDGNFAGYRCPRCTYTGLHGRHRTYGERTIEEFFCPHCQLAEVADSDQPTYRAMLERWRPA
jgi:hypothetical protein